MKAMGYAGFTEATGTIDTVQVPLHTRLLT
jgi:hypothetical protein